MSKEENGMKKAFSFGVKDVVQKFHKTQSGLSSLQKASYRVDSRMNKRASVEDMNTQLLISPSNPVYRTWWYFTTVCSLFTGFFTPWEVAFENRPGLSPYNDSPAAIEFFLSAVFLVDIIVHFFLPSKRPNGLIETTWKSVALRYLRTWFVIDLLGVIPFAAIVAESGVSSNLGVLRRVGLLRLLRLVRLHRVFHLFQEFESNVHISLVATTLIRNMTIVVLVGHFAGCMFYFISIWYDFGSDTWIGDNLELEYMSRAEKYIYSFYYSITTMTTVGYGDFSPGNTAEVIFGTVYMLFNIVLNSYILGTITMVVIKADENNTHLRNMFKKLKYFSELNDLERPHKEMLKNYIQFNLANPDLQEDELLKALPHGARRSVLKNLYVPLLQDVDILEGTSIGFLLRLLEFAEIDIYMPDQVIIPCGDYVHELNIMLTGQAICCSREESSEKPDHGLLIDEGCAFLTENFINLEEVNLNVWSRTICRVLIIPRANYNATCDEFPKDKIIMDRNRASLAMKAQSSPRLRMTSPPKNNEQENEVEISWEDEENNVSNGRRSPLTGVLPAVDGLRTRDSATSRE